MNKNECVMDVTALYGIIVSAIVIITSQAIVFIFCKIKYREINKKPIQISWEEVFREGG